MKLSDRIRQIREANNLTQAAVANKCGMTPSGYGQIERKPYSSTFETLQKIAKGIGVTTPFLIDVQDPNFIEKNKL
jgi:transcriptional regulator with XRE-family HTH domain